MGEDYPCLGKVIRKAQLQTAIATASSEPRQLSGDDEIKKGKKQELSHFGTLREF
jgi:hypothetical protein